MSRPHRMRSVVILLVAGVCLFSTPAAAHPGSGIVIDRLGQIYFVDMVSGVWKVDTHGALTHLPGPAFHWMTLDADNQFGAVRLPSGSGGDVARLGANPVLLLASSFPVAMGRDGNLYYPTHGTGVPDPLQMMKLLPSGQASSLASLPSTTTGLPIRDVNGLAAGPEGSVYYTERDAIRRISRDGHVSIVVENILRAHCASTQQGAPEPLLRGLDVDSAGTIYVAATGCGSVLKITPAGKVTLLFQLPSPWSPTGIALFGKNVYVLEFLHPESDDRAEMLPRVRKITPDGRTTIIATVRRH